MKHTNGHILELLEEWAPQSAKLEYDNVGLLVGDEKKEVEKVLVCLDATPDVVEEAISSHADLIVAHHPLIFRNISRINPSDTTGYIIYRLVRHDIALIAAHTNLDAAYGGVSFVMAQRLGLKNVRFLKDTNVVVERWTAGDEWNRSPESETPTPTGFGAVGELPDSVTPREFVTLVREKLGSRGIRYSGGRDLVQKVAVCGGSGSFLVDEARSQNVDAYVTADLKYHDFFTDSPSFLLVDAGHYESEVPVVKTMCDWLYSRFPGLEVFTTSINTNPINYFS